MLNFARCAPAITISAASILVGCSTGAPRALQPQTETAIAGPGFYKIQAGDTLRRIAERAGQRWQDIRQWNNMENPDLIEIGQILRVTPPLGWQEETPNRVAQSTASAELADAPRTPLPASTGGSFQRTDSTQIIPTNTATSGSGCRTSLSHLGPRLPQYRVQELQESRSAILTEDLGAAMNKARAMGYTPASAASAALRSAKNAESEVEKAKACIHAFATNPNDVISQLEQGRFSFSGSRIQDLSTHESCAAIYVVLKYTAVASRESAIQMACLASAR